MNYSARRKRGFRIGLIITLIVLIVGLFVAAFTVRNAYNQNIKPLSSSQEEQLFTVQSGETAHDIAVALQDQQLIRAAWAFEWYVRSHNLREQLQAGSYYVRPSQSVSEIVGIITGGKVATDLVTILPAQRLDQIKAALIKAGYGDSEVTVALDPAKYANHPALVDKPAGATLEGYLYPESFQRTADTSLDDIVRLSLDAMQQHLTPDARAAFVKNGLTVHQGVILASIVEEETGKPEDRPMVAQVLLKRLSIGMQLGSDPTAHYGAIMAGQAPSINYDTPYNTRMHSGIPPGPISNVSDSSLRAVAYPSNTDYLFFVAGDDGVTHFTKTLQEHQSATAQYCTKLCAQE